MSEHAVIALVDDLMTVSRLESAAHAIGTTIVFPSNEAELERAIEDAKGRPALMLVGLAATKLPWETLVPFSQSTASSHDVTLEVIAFGPHMDIKLRQRALDAGIKEIWANSRLMTDLPKLLNEE